MSPIKLHYRISILQELIEMDVVDSTRDGPTKPSDGSVSVHYQHAVCMGVLIDVERLSQDAVVRCIHVAWRAICIHDLISRCVDIFLSIVVEVWAMIWRALLKVTRLRGFVPRKLLRWIYILRRNMYIGRENEKDNENTKKKQIGKKIVTEKSVQIKMKRVWKGRATPVD